MVKINRFSKLTLLSTGVVRRPFLKIPSVTGTTDNPQSKILRPKSSNQSPVTKVIQPNSLTKVLSQKSQAQSPQSKILSPKLSVQSPKSWSLKYSVKSPNSKTKVSRLIASIDHFWCYSFFLAWLFKHGNIYWYTIWDVLRNQWYIDEE